MIRRMLAVPSSVLVICLFLPALSVCNSPEAPISFPPCYAAYLGGLGVLAIAIARARASRLAAVGAAIPLALLVLTAGGILVACCSEGGLIVGAAGIAGGALSLVAAAAIVRRYVKTPPSEIGMATSVLVQGAVSISWTGLLAGDRGALWGTFLALGAASMIAVGALAWLVRARAQPARAVPLPRAVVMPLRWP
jgi:hypothetical protein